MNTRDKDTPCPHSSSDDDDAWFTDLDGPCDPEELNELPPAKNSREGIAAERRWVEENFPGSRWLRQRSRKNKEGRQIDEITLVTASGTEFPVYFDVTDWFGKD